MKNIYYLLKPIIPRDIRMALRRVFANRIRKRSRHSWPISESAGSLPQGWPGWPEGKQFAFVLTHDVEGAKGFERTRRLAEMDKVLGFRSSFNFVPEGEYLVPESLRMFLAQEGFEVGVHDLHHDGTLYRSSRTFKDQAGRINHHLQSWGAVGFRSGFMFHNLEWIKDLNVLYDASTFDIDPFEPQPDGVHTIFPFWVKKEGSTGYVELPYTLPQDSTLFILFNESTIDLWVKKLDWIAARGGMALLNTHPDYINFDGRPDSSEYSAGLYESFLKHVATRYRDKCWFALPREIAEYVSRFKPSLRA